MKHCTIIFYWESIVSVISSNNLLIQTPVISKPGHLSCISCIWNTKSEIKELKNSRAITKLGKGKVCLIFAHKINGERNEKWQWGEAMEEHQESLLGTSLVVQWLWICLPVQGTWVWSMVEELRSHMPQDNSAIHHHPWAHTSWSLCATTTELTQLDEEPTWVIRVDSMSLFPSSELPSWRRIILPLWI